MLATDLKQRERYLLQLKTFRDRLLSIDTRNPSIFLRRTVKKSSFDVHLHVGDKADGLLLRARKAPADVLLIPERDVSEPAVEARTSIAQLLRFSDARTEETGLRELFLGCCWAEGFVAPEVYVRGPLVLLPVRLEHRLKVQRPGWYAVFDTSNIVLNRALLGTLRKHLAYAAPEDLAEVAQKGFMDPQATTDSAVHDALVAAFTSAGVPLEHALYDPTHRISALTKGDLAELGAVPLAARSYLVIGMFRQASTALYMDLEELVRRAADGDTDHGIIDNLLDAGADDPAANEANFGEIRLDEVADRQLNLVLPSDPSQDQVVVRAQKADCVVVRGPPGTGKSQVIVNLVADALTRGDRVLVVCQKRAALDVVHQRMQQVGLGDCAYLVHDADADRPALYERIGKVLTGGNDGPEDPQTIESLSREIDHLIGDVRAIVEPLREKRHGVQISSLYKRACPHFRPQLRVASDIVPDDEGLAALVSLIRRIEPGCRRFDVPSAPTAQRSSWADVGHLQRAALLEALEALVIDARSAGTPKRLDDERSRSRLLAGLAAHAKLSGRWYRYFLPSWYAARIAIRGNEVAMAPLPLDAWAAAVRKAEVLRGLIQQVGRVMRPEWVQDALALIERPLDLALTADALRAAVANEFSAIQQHDRTRQSAVNFESVISTCVAKLQSELDWGDSVFQAVTLQWIEEAENAYPTLKGDPLKAYESLRARLQALLDRKREAVRAGLARTLRHRASTPVPAPDAAATGRSRQQGQAQALWTKLAHEVSKKRRIKPLRALVSEFAHPLKLVAPCWLASPEVVAEVFPLERGLFDLVIFDEASQLAVERAIPVLYRAKRVVVAGDEQQMPPSDFFESAQEELEEERAEEDPPEALKVDSLLILAKRIYGQNYLGWHYRSEHQELIEYSNHAFYDGNLNVAANVSRGGAAVPAIRWVPVAGTWVDNRNLVESQKVVDLLHDVLREEGVPTSVAVVTFNILQAEAVKDEVERRRQADADFAALLLNAESRERVDDRPVVKNIENIQGDERDVVIFSIGYGQGPDGVLRKNFGPLSVEGGENRLNVAVTRARRAIYVVCSFDPETLAVETAKNLGPVRFKQYLQYARFVSAGDRARLGKLITDINPAVAVGAAAPLQKAFESPFEEQVYDRLVQRGFQVDTQIGLSGYRIDLAIVDPTDPSRYCLGIECDGAQFHSGKSVRERDLARQRFLEAKGWHIARVWSRNWWMNPDAEVERIVQAAGGR